ncbi:MAG TPA: tol-pal system-associated acyl-CoA thioesterase [Gammaproteobacteria bacterium]
MFHWPVRVYYEDTDSGGVVYYANYLKYMERARTEWLRSFGIEQDELLGRQGIIFAVHSVTLDFLRPGRFNELLFVSVQVAQRRRASLIFAQEIMRLSTGKAGQMQIDNAAEENRTVLCSGHIRVACLDAASMRPRQIPDYVLTEIACDS